MKRLEHGHDEITEPQNREAQLDGWSLGATMNARQANRNTSSSVKEACNHPAICSKSYGNQQYVAAGRGFRWIDGLHISIGF